MGILNDLLNYIAGKYSQRVDEVHSEMERLESRSVDDLLKIINRHFRTRTIASAEAGAAYNLLKQRGLDSEEIDAKIKQMNM